MEYQAKELFAKHGVPVTLGTVVDDGRGRRGRGRGAGRPRRRQGAGQGRRPRQGRRREARRDPRRGRRSAPRTSSAWTSRASPSTGCWSRRPPTSRRSTTSPSWSTAPTATTSASPASRAASRSRRSRTTNPDARRQQISIDPQAGVDDAKAAEIVAATGFPAEVADQAKDVIKKLWDVFIEEDATLVEVNPLVPAGRRHARGARRQGLPRRERRASATRTTPQFEDKDAADPLEAKAKAKGLNYVKLDGDVGIIGNGAGLVMSTLDVVAYAGEKHGGVKPANFLDIGGGAIGRGDGQRPRRDPQRRAGQERLRQRLRRHHRLRRGRQRHRAARWRSSATRPTSRSSYASTATTSRRAAGSSTRPNHPLVTLVDTMDGAADQAAELARTLEERD